MMRTDICYLEKSSLLASSLCLELPELKWAVSENETDFLKSLVETPPLLLIIGDTGTSNAVELLYCIKSLKGFKKLPIIFYGETEFDHILPVNKFFQRNIEILPIFKDFINKYLDKSSRDFGEERGGWLRPEGLTNPGFLRKQARSLLKEEMFRKHLYNEITGMDVTDLSFCDFLNKLCSRLETLLSVDFVAITYRQNGITLGKLYLHNNPGVTAIEKIRNLCLKCLPPDTEKTILTGENICIKEGSSEGIIKTPPEVNLCRQLPPTGEEHGRLIVGSFENTVEIPEKLGSQLTEMVNEVVEQADGHYQQICETKLIYKAFSQFLPAPIINDLLLKESEKALLTGEKRRIVVLFSHVRNFDHIIEHNEAAEVVGFLNSHFTNMVKIIQDHGGSIDKFIGDAVFAIFGAPISYIDNTKRAADAALEMIRRYRDIPVDGINLPDNGFSIGVGLNEGEAIIGNIGCSDKFDYTAIGDTVNLAARLESLTKHYRQDILISKVVYCQIQKDYYCRLIDRAKVKGKNEATEIFSLLVNPEPYTEKWRQLYSRGLKMYSLGNWYTAETYLEECLKILPNDIVCEILLKRCRDFQASPPEAWCGAVTLDFK